ncbi:thioredoxin-dependent thiol peroxidase [Geomicrobium sp. JCM 19039]|uniref:thioredoxin-dependent thiol peroxidase n=1 Tax=Geomicrobium sp. JCM 19039 TaxID=1460636 RepID=UPI0005AA897D|nr:thioredoxin-dependent thiol peroxidase [Geomicrobium sp. JCM 19039]
MDLTNQTAPEFSLEAHDGTRVSLSDYKGKYIVLYFYPKDMTPGCTTQACDFRDALPALNDTGVVVLGVSPDSVDRHVKFVQKHDLPFLLIADPEKQAAEKYGVWQLKKNFGKEYMGIVRSTFVISPEGEILKEWRNVRVKNHVADVQAFIESVQK